MLHGWNSPAETAGLAEELADVGKDDEVHCWKDKGQVCSELNCGDEFTSVMRKEINQLVEEKFSDVFTDTPGRTEVIEHDI